MSKIKVSRDEISPILITVLVLCLFWCSPPDLTWRIADVGESQTIRETILIFVLFGFSLFAIWNQRIQSQLQSFICRPDVRTILIFGISILLWQWISLLVNGLSTLGTSYCILWLSYIVLFVLTGCLFQGSISHCEKVLQAISISTILASLYLLLKSIENDLSCPNILLNAVRLSFGEYLVIGWSMITGLFLYAEARRLKIIWGGGLFFTTLAILQTSHRSPILGITVSFICLVILSYKVRHFKIKLSRWATFLCIVISAILIQTLVYTQLDHSNSRVTIQKRLLQNEEHSVGYRLFLLRICGHMFVNKPLLGLGTAAFGKNYFQSQLALAHRPEYNEIAPTLEKLGAERAHNEFAQILAENGVIGFILVFCFLSSTLYFAYKTASQNQSSKHHIILIPALIGFLASSVTSGFSWRWASNGALFFFILGLVQVQAPYLLTQYLTCKLKHVLILIILTTSFLIIGVAWQINKSIGQLQYAKGYIFANHGEQEQATRYFLSSLKHNPENWRASFSLGKLYLIENKQQEALDSFTSASCYRVNGVDHLIILARLHESLDKPPKNQQIKEIYESAISAYPQSPWVKLFYAHYLLSQGETQKARQLADESKKLDPLLYQAAKSYFSGNPTQGHDSFISQGKIDDLIRFETLYFCK